MCHVFFFDCPVFPVICTTVRDGFVQISFKSVDRIVLFVTFPDIDKDFLHDIFSHLVIFHSAFRKKDKVTIKLLKEFMISLFVFQVKALQKIFLFAHSVFRRFTEQNKGLIIDYPIYIPNSFEKLCQQSPYFILFLR